MPSRFLFFQRLKLLKKNSFPREFLKFTLYIILPVVVFYSAGQPILKDKMANMILDDNFRREYAKLYRGVEEGRDREDNISRYETHRKLHESRVQAFLEKQMEQSMRDLETNLHGEDSHKAHNGIKRLQQQQSALEKVVPAPAQEENSDRL